MGGSHGLRLPAVLGVVVLAASLGCAPAHYARNIGKDNVAAGIGIGGPFIAPGSLPPFPAPVAAGWVKFGVTERMDLYSELGLTQLAFGNFAWAFGAVYQVIEQRKAVPGFAIHAALHVLTDFDEARVWPQLGGIFSYKFKRASLVYLGVTSMTQLDPPLFRFAPLVGTELRFHKHLSFVLEGRWYLPGMRTELLSLPDYVTVGGRGGIGILLGLSFHLDRERP